jgi:hypothetical protein
LPHPSTQLLQEIDTRYWVAYWTIKVGENVDITVRKTSDGSLLKTLSVYESLDFLDAMADSDVEYHVRVASPWVLFKDIVGLLERIVFIAASATGTLWESNLVLDPTAVVDALSEHFGSVDTGLTLPAQYYFTDIENGVITIVRSGIGDFPFLSDTTYQNAYINGPIVRSNLAPLFGEDRFWRTRFYSSPLHYLPSGVFVSGRTVMNCVLPLSDPYGSDIAMGAYYKDTTLCADKDASAAWIADVIPPSGAPGDRPEDTLTFSTAVV